MQTRSPAPSATWPPSARRRGRAAPGSCWSSSPRAASQGLAGDPARDGGGLAAGGPTAAGRRGQRHLPGSGRRPRTPRTWVLEMAGNNTSPTSLRHHYDQTPSSDGIPAHGDVGDVLVRLISVEDT